MTFLHLYFSKLSLMLYHVVAVECILRYYTMPKYTLKSLEHETNVEQVNIDCEVQDLKLVT